MTDQPPGIRPPTPPDPGDPAPGQQGPAPSGGREAQRFTDRVWSFQALVVVALVALLLGGLAGAGLANVSHRDEERYGPGQRHFDGAPWVTLAPRSDMSPTLTH